MRQTAEIKQTIRQFVYQQFPAARTAAIADSDSLLKPGIVDSLGALEIVTFLEDEFSISLTDDEMLAGHFESIETLTELVDHKLSTAR